MRICHVVVTGNFAGTERYVSEVARTQAALGHQVHVVGGDPLQMQGWLGTAQWHAGAGVRPALAGLAALGRLDVVHAHLTAAELVATLGKPRHRAKVLSTRHIAAPRGSSVLGRAARPLVRWGVDTEIAISRHVDAACGPGRRTVLHNGVEASAAPYAGDAKTVLLLQRLEPEKDTATALRAWARSGLAELGWHLLVAGDGSQRQMLTALVAELGATSVEFLGHVQDVAALLARTALLLAPATSEPLGLTVLEAMARGIPVVASAAGGHLETLGEHYPYVFAPGDPAGAAAVLALAAGESARREQLSDQLRARQQASFALPGHVEALLGLYGDRPA